MKQKKLLLLIILTIFIFACERVEHQDENIVILDTDFGHFEKKFIRLSKVQISDEDIYRNYIGFTLNEVTIDSMVFDINCFMTLQFEYHPESIGVECSYSKFYSKFTMGLVSISDGTTQQFTSNICKEYNFSCEIQSIEFIDEQDGFYSAIFSGIICDSTDNIISIENG
ncbi:unnamed protein product, partial [marine sediment metagenome]